MVFSTRSQHMGFQQNGMSASLFASPLYDAEGEEKCLLLVQSCDLEHHIHWQTISVGMVFFNGVRRTRDIQRDMCCAGRMGSTMKHYEEKHSIREA